MIYEKCVKCGRQINTENEAFSFVQEGFICRDCRNDIFQLNVVENDGEKIRIGGVDA